MEPETIDLHKIDAFFRLAVERPVRNGEMDRRPALDDALAAAQTYGDLLASLDLEQPEWLAWFNLALIYAGE